VWITISGKEAHHEMPRRVPHVAARVPGRESDGRGPGRESDGRPGRESDGRPGRRPGDGDEPGRGSGRGAMDGDGDGPGRGPGRGAVDGDGDGPGPDPMDQFVDGPGAGDHHSRVEPSRRLTPPPPSILARATGPWLYGPLPYW